jgi:hypothetical protein
MINKENRMYLSSFWKGCAAAFDLTGQSFISIPDLSTGFQRDREALAGDWKRIGGDIRKAMNQIACEK